MGHLAAKVEESLLAGHHHITATTLNLDELDDGAWAACLVQASHNATKCLDLVHDQQVLFWSEARILVQASPASKLVPAALRVGLAVLFGKVLSGKSTQNPPKQLLPWLTTHNAGVACELTVAMLSDASAMLSHTHTRLRNTAMEALQAATLAQPYALVLNKDAMLKLLEHGGCGDRRMMGLQMMHACYPALPPNVVITVAALLVDTDDRVRGHARALLIEMVDKEGSGCAQDVQARRKDTMLNGLIKGWFPDDEDKNAQEAELWHDDQVNDVYIYVYIYKYINVYIYMYM